MNLGAWQLDTVSGGRFRLDGGAMFGLVPKPLWEQQIPADDQNRIEMDTNCVLARDGRHAVLIDTGYGGKGTAKQQTQMALEPGEPLVASLAKLGLEVADIDTVVLSHLHFDHAGGGTRMDDAGELVTTFPNAIYVAGRIEWQDATSGAAELRGSYPLENLLPLEKSGRLRLIEDGDAIVPGIIAERTGGHTLGHMLIAIESAGERAAYVADICPTRWHMPSHWCMGYDMYLRDTRLCKPRILGRAADEQWLVLWDHDPGLAAARIARDPKREFVVVEEFASL